MDKAVLGTLEGSAAWQEKVAGDDSYSSIYSKALSVILGLAEGQDTRDEP